MLFYSFGFLRALPAVLLMTLIVRIVSRWVLFKKMGLKPAVSLIPIVAEYKIFKKCWVVWPYVVLLLLTIVLGAWIPITGYANINLPIPIFIKSNFQVMSLVAFVSLSVLMNKRLAFSFGHDLLFTIGLVLLNPIFLGILAFSKDRYQPERAKLYGKAFVEYKVKDRNRANRIVSLVSAMVLVFVTVMYVGNVVRTEQMPSYFVQKNNDKIYEQTAGKVRGTGSVVYPGGEDDAEAADDGSSGSQAEAADSADTAATRDLYYPSKAGNTETTVLVYMIGSDLEDANGSASINLRQMIDATKAGKSLKFVLEAGGSGRWFTRGMSRMRTGRYLISDGKLTMLKKLDKHVSMSDPKTLEDFLRWGNEQYPGGRRMLFFWNHGGALSGFGYDKVNIRPGQEMLALTEIRDALDKEGTKYDLIGFDACLMQSLEVGLALEPYADYLLASEEGEPSSGLYYTTAFSRLAREPDLDTKTFGAMMCSSYDQSLELINGFPQAGATLSMVDLRYLPSVNKVFSEHLQSLDSRFKEDEESFVNMSTARFKAYEFQMEDQIDLMDFVKHSKMSQEERDEITSVVNRALVVRNSASASQINGLAVYMPYDDLNTYSSKRKTMNALGMKATTKVYSDFASIIGSQKFDKESKGSSYLEYEDWFVKDYKDYDASVHKQDIKLLKNKGDRTNHIIDLTEDEWKNVVNYELGLRMKVGERYADLGSDNIYDRDKNGHPMVGFDKTWVAINDTVVALKPGMPIEADEDTIIYTGTVNATMNFITPITIYMRWVNEGDHEGDGEVIGYLEAEDVDDNFDARGMPRGYKTFKPNTIITFLYDWYDQDGNYLITAMGHLPVRVGSKGLKVTQKDISSADYEYFGILYDVMNRTMETEKLTHEKE